MYPELCPFNYEKLCIILIYGKIKKPLKSLDLGGFRGFCETTGGERGIRTPGPVTVNSFQDCRIRPLCHFSNKAHIISLMRLQI